MSLEDRQNDQHDNRAQDAEINSVARIGPRNVDDAKTGFHILAAMIADFHLQRKRSCKQSSVDEESCNTSG